MIYPERVIIFSGKVSELELPINTADFTHGVWYLTLDSIGASSVTSSCFAKISCNFVTQKYVNFQGNHTITEQPLHTTLFHPLARGLLYITPLKKYHKCTNITNLMKIEIECLDGSVLKDTFFNVQVSLYKE